MHEFGPRHAAIRTDARPARRGPGLGVARRLLGASRGGCADGARRSGDSRRRLGAGLRRARKEGSEGRLHSAHRLRVGRHGVGHGIRQEVRHQDRADQGSVVGGGARQARQRRARRRARALRPDLRRAAGHRRTEEGHGRADEPQSQRPGDHAVEPAEGQGRDRRREAQGADRQGEARVHVRADVPHRHARDVDLLLARGATASTRSPT